MRRVLLALVVGSALTLASCGSSSRSFVRIVNAGPDAGTIDVTLNGNKLLTAMAYGSGSNYFTVSPGTMIDLKIHTGGGVTIGVNTSVATDFDTNIGLTNGVYYTIAAVGLTAAPSTFTILQAEDDHTAPATNDVKIRVLQLDPLFHVNPGDNSPVDAYVTVPTASLNGMSPSFPDLTFQSTPSFVSVTLPTDGNLRLRAAPSGDPDPDGTNLSGWDSQIVLFKTGQVRTYVLLHNPTGTPFPNQSLMLSDLN